MAADELGRALDREVARRSYSARCSSGDANVPSTATAHGAAHKASSSAISTSGFDGVLEHTAGTRPRPARRVAVGVRRVDGHQVDPARGGKAREQRARPRVARRRTDDAPAERRAVSNTAEIAAMPDPKATATPALQSAHRLLERRPAGRTLLARVARAKKFEAGTSGGFTGAARHARAAAGVDRRRFPAGVQACGRTIQRLLTICNRRYAADAALSAALRCRCRDRGRGRGRRQRRVPPRRGGRRGRAARARPAGQRLDVEGRGRRARPVLATRSTSRSPSAASPRTSVRAAAGLGDRLRGDRLPLRAHHARASVEAFKQSVALQNELGVPSRIITPEEAREICPLIAGRGHPGRELLPDRRARHARVASCRATRPARAQHGAHIASRPPVEGIDVARRHHQRGRARTRGTVATDTVDLRRGRRGRARAGRWPASRSTSRRCAARCSSPRRCPTCRARLPLTIDFATGFYFHREGRGLLMGMADPNETPGFLTGDHRRLDPGPARDRRAARAAASPRRRSRAAGPASTT